MTQTQTQTVTAPGTPGQSPRPPRGRVAQRSLLRRSLARPEVGSLVGAIAIFTVFLVTAPPMREAASLSTVLYATSTIGIMAVPVALLMIGGEFDLSAGVGVITSGLTASMFAYHLNTNVWVGIGVALAVSLAIGFLNGWLLVKTKLPSFLITLSTFLMLQGLNVAMTKLVTGEVATPSIEDMDGFASAHAVFASAFTIGGVQVRITAVWWLVFVAAATWVLLRTGAGNWIYAAGGDQHSARAVGVPVNRVKTGLFMLVGFGAWFSGMHLLFAFNSLQSGSGIGNELLYIMAAVIGGCMLTGGYGTAVGSAIGAVIYGTTKQGIVYADWDNNWLMFFVGAMLLIATVVNLWVRNQKDKR